MLTPELANELQSKGFNPKDLNMIAFAEDSSLWHKQKHFVGFKHHENGAKRYEFFKMGKLLGLETKRYVSQWQGHLFYFNDLDEETDYVGFCNLENVYIQWLPLQTDRYALILSNGTDCSIFYFSSPSFWVQQQEEIVKYTVQLNFKEKYQMERCLGSGSFSQVHKVKSKKNGEYMAAKVINKLDKKQMCTKKMAASERKILHLMREESGVCKFKQFFETQKSYIIILDYVPGVTLMTLFDQKQQLSLAKMKNLFRAILTIIKQCHQKNIIHRDIKPHNIILSHDHEQPKLIDFGLALITSKEMEPFNYYKCGTMGYTAPEVLLTDSMFYKSYGYKCDIFSFGVVAHMLLMGNNPLAGKSDIQRKKDIHVEFKEDQIIQKYGQSCLNFLKKLMAANPRQRYTAEQALRSTFLRDQHDHDEIHENESSLYNTMVLGASV